MEVETNDLKSKLQLSKSKTSVLYLEIYRKLRDLIINGELKKGQKLIAEGEMAKIMNVGRTSLRSALVILSEDGYIKTYQGKGTFVTFDAESPKEAYSSQYMLPMKRLQRKNKLITCDLNIVSDVGFDGYLDEKLKAKGSQILMLKRGYYLDGSPAILSMVFVRKDVLGGDVSEDFDSNYKKFITIYDENVSYVNNTLSPVSSLNNQSKFFNEISPETILLSAATLYGEDDEPLAFIKDYYNTNEIEYRIKMFK